MEWRFAIFAKFSDAENGLGQFEIELSGLHSLHTLSGVLTPTPICTMSVAGGSILVMEAVHNHPGLREAAARLGKQIRAEPGVETAVQLIEQIFSGY